MTRQHPLAGKLRCSCGGRVLLLFETRTDGTTWVIPRCDHCLADTEWIPIDLGDSGPIDLPAHSTPEGS